LSKTQVGRKIPEVHHVEGVVIRIEAVGKLGLQQWITGLHLQGIAVVRNILQLANGWLIGSPGITES
jgi:hypothetical protein